VDTNVAKMSHLPELGDFSWYPCKNFGDALSKTFNAVTNCNAWDYLMTFEPRDQGFMYSQDPVIAQIQGESIKLGAGHTGCSFGLCMRVMHVIARKGWIGYYYQVS